MAFDQGLIDWVEEAMAPLGTVALRKMMGGTTLYLDGTIFAIAASEGRLWFKSDAESDAIWDAAGCERFGYTFPDGKTGTMNYRLAPEDVYDDADVLREWASLGVAAGLRAPVKKRAAKKSR
jgi:DNA transformation protein